FFFADDNLVLISATEDEKGSNIIKSMLTRKVIYNANLVKEILEHFEIDYKGKNCFTFNEIEAVEGIENAVAVKIK
ncbi:MAG: hypothetical protein IJA21_07445, partial [Clostridia bacterium]|nr:hypothetical protein [Clostridia bacterium]